MGSSPEDHKESEMTKHIRTAKERDAKDEAMIREWERSGQPWMTVPVNWRKVLSMRTNC